MGTPQKKKDGLASAEAFTLEDVQSTLQERGDQQGAVVTDLSAADAILEAKKSRENAEKKMATSSARISSKRTAASIVDILGFDPNGGKEDLRVEYNRDSAPEEWRKIFDTLIGMREELLNRVETHTAETLQQNDKDAVDRPHMLGQHTADSAAEQADLERAMSFVENEQELLREVNGALERIKKGTYGICEQTGEKIDKKRLEALPFARFSLKGQEEFERTRKSFAASTREGPLFTYSGDELEGLGAENDSEETGQ